LIESAKLDGAGEFTIFTKIVLPIMKPAIASVSFMQAVTYWNDWNKAYLYIESANKTPLQLLLIRIEKNIQYILTEQNLLSAEEYASMIKDLPTDSGRMAILLTAIGPIMIAYPFFQKYFVKGLTVGSVKG
jgi:multiple sugar transport system permease protein/putative aldouronate transport system permease protein